MGELVYKLEAVAFSYPAGPAALAGIDLDIPPGSKVALVGANGSGKSTLLCLLDALAFPLRGSIHFLGRDLARTASMENFSAWFRKKVGLMFQNPDVQLFCPTVRDDIAFGPLQLGVGPSETHRRVENLADMLGIRRLLERTPGQLSLGERRKAALASTLAIDPEVLLLDEPTAGLDPRTCAQVLDIILEASANGKTVIIATHDLHLAEEAGDEMVVLGTGGVVAGRGTPAAILADQALLAANNLVHAHVHRHQGRAHAHPHQHSGHNL